MAKVARWVDASLIPKQHAKRETYVKVDQDLQTRIRSLFIARNGPCPPQTPFSYPDYASSPYDSPEGCSGHSSKYAASRCPGAVKATAKLIDMELRNLSIMTNMFDGPASPVVYSDLDLHRKLPGELDNEQNDGYIQDGPNLKLHFGSNNFAAKDHHQQSHLNSEDPTAILTIRPPSRSMSQSSKQSSSSHAPPYTIRTVPPTSSYLKSMPLKPEIQNMPGSYISDIDTSTPRGTPSVASVSDSKSVKSVSTSKLDHSILGTNLEPQSRAVESLRKAIDQNKFGGTSHSKPLLQRELSQTSLKSNTSTLNSRHLLKLSTGRHELSQAAEPILTLDVSQGHSFGESVETFQSISSGHTGVESPKVTSTESGSVDADPDHTLSSTRTISAFNDSPDVPISPSLYTDINGSDDTSSADKPPIRSGFEPLIDQRFAKSDSALPPSDGLQNFASTHESAPRGTSELPSSLEIRPVNDTDQDVSSVIAKKLSGIERAPTGLSETGHLPTLQPPSSGSLMNNEGKAGISRKDSCEQMTPPSPPQNRSVKSKGSFNRANFANDSISTSKEGAEPTKHWIQQLLAKKSSRSFTSTYTKIPASSRRHSSTKHQTKNPSPKLSLDADNDIFPERQKNNEPFNRVIEDLEGLLNEALDLARQATDPVAHEISLSSLGQPANHESEVFSNSESSSIDTDSDGMSLNSGELDVERQKTTLPVLYNHYNNHNLNQGKPQNSKGTSPTQDGPVEKVWGHNIVQKSTDNFQDGKNSWEPAKRDTDTILKSLETRDWAFAERPHFVLKPRAAASKNMVLSQKPNFVIEKQDLVVHDNDPTQKFTSGASVRHPTTREPRIQTRSSSIGQPTRQNQNWGHGFHKSLALDENIPLYVEKSLPALSLQNRTETQPTITNAPKPRHSSIPSMGHLQRNDSSALRGQSDQPNKYELQDQGSLSRDFSLTSRRDRSVREAHGFSFSRSHRRSPIARDWRTSRKRYVATVTCVNTALMGFIIGIYAGEVPAIQYSIVDEHHYTILGNVVFFIGVAITTALFWPLPLLHGRKPYTLAALAILLPLQFPQALAVGATRSPDVVTYRIGLLLSRSFSGLVIGFANINFKTTLLDLFGASLQSSHPHQETVSSNDIRRHGGGMGVWLGIWTWCSIGSIGVGFLIGAVVISGLNVSWGFWLTIILTASVLILNVITPEVRRSRYRRSMVEVKDGSEVSRRFFKGEIKIHIDASGPKWWGEEVSAGLRLGLRMLKQPGFTILALYMGWIYGQIVMVIVLLGALTSKYYHFHPQYVGLCVAAVPLGALLAIPFQKASLFSRSRKQPPRTDSMTVRDQITWTSHLVRRAFFMISLPFAGLAYTLASGGAHTNFTVPTFFAGLIGFLSNLAIAECNGIIMETYDTSDLQPGMTGRPRRALPEEIRKKRTNYSCFPRVAAAFAIVQSFAFLIAAAATGSGGAIERRLGAQTATAVVAAVLLVLTILLIGVLWRFKIVQVIPSKRFGTNILTGPEDEWKPIIIGNPSGTTRRMSLLELGKQSRWSEIRRRNKLAPDES